MIVFFGHPDDPPLAMAVASARGRGVPHVAVDQHDLDDAVCDVVVTTAGVGGRLVVGDADLALADVGAVYARPLHTTGPDGAPRPSAALQAEAAFVDWLDVADARVLNRPSAMASNTSKPLQAQLIARHGFAVPPTVVTSDPAAVRAFHAAHGRVVFKSVSGVRSIVRDLDTVALRRLGRVRALPTQFQAHVPGVDVRVHVVGATTFAVRIASEATDYRYAHRDGLDVDLSVVDLPADVADRCVALARALGLPLCGIDLRQGPDGTWVCLEANPMPAYSYYERTTGVPIADAIVDLLVAADRAVPEPA